MQQKIIVISTELFFTRVIETHILNHDCDKYHIRLEEEKWSVHQCLAPLSIQVLLTARNIRKKY
jgi:hypothetical protein